MDWVQVWTIIAAIAGLLTLQAYWIGRSQDDLRRELGELRRETERGFDRVDTRLDRVETLLAGHTERVARLEARQ